MATANICRGEQCPVKKRCLRFSLWLQEVCSGNTHPRCIAKCPEGKWFIRNEKDNHSQSKQQQHEKQDSNLV